MITIYFPKKDIKVVGEIMEKVDFDMIQTPSIFGDKKTFILKEVTPEIIERLPDVQNAPHDVVIVLDKLLAADKKKLEKIATIHEYQEPTKKETSFNPFSLANTFATRDKKKTWITFQELLKHDDEMEKTHGMIWWKVKQMNDSDLAWKLVVAYHESRLGGLNLQERLEKLFLEIETNK